MEQPYWLGNGPFGLPDSIYAFPDAFEDEDYLIPVAMEDSNACKPYCKFDNLPCDPDIFGLCCLIMEDNNWNVPDETSNKLNLYIQLRDYVLNVLS